MYTHIYNNVKEYISVIIVLLIGIIIGVITLNNIDNIQKDEIENYICQFVNTLSENKDIDKFNLFKNIAINNLLLVIIFVVLGTTLIGVPIIYIIVAYKGFCLSFTISSFIAVLGVKKALVFIFTIFFLQNLIYIPCILALAVSGLRLYKFIIKDKKIENIKIEITKHFVISIFIALVMILGALIEVYISGNIAMLLSNSFKIL